VLLGLLLVRLVVALPPAQACPLDYYSVEPRWHETSLWLAQSLRPGQRFALPYQSLYSTWDAPRPETDTRWSFWYGMNAPDLRRYLGGANIAHLLVDTQASGFAEYADKLSSAKDDHGSLSFLDWPRCFADSGQPSRFSIYCRPDPAHTP
jgi:hypothetical protein